MTAVSSAIDFTKTENKCLLWNSIAVPRFPQGGYPYGFKNYSRMVMFLQQNDFNKKDKEYYMSLPNNRTEGEDYTYYRIRRQFCQALVKYRTSIQKIIFVKAVQALKEKNKNGATN